MKQAFNRNGNDWGWRDFFEAARDLDELLNLAGQYQKQADTLNAAMIYRVVADEILRHENILMDEETDRLRGLVDNCVEGLGLCLQSIQDSNTRRDILQAIIKVFLWNIRMGGVGIGDRVPEILLENATTQEKELLAGWIQSELLVMSDWGREALGGLLLDLQAETLDDESFLEICRQTGRLNDLVERLLQLGRLDEAVVETEKAEDNYLLDLANQFVRNGHGSLAERLIQNRSKTSRDLRLTIWLKDYASQQGNFSTASS